MPAAEPRADGLAVMAQVAGDCRDRPAPAVERVRVHTVLPYEFAEAAGPGMPRLVFLLGEDTTGSRELLVDTYHGARQEAFRRRLADSGITVRTVTSPAELNKKLFQALTELPRGWYADRAGMECPGSGRVVHRPRGP